MQKDRVALNKMVLQLRIKLLIVIGLLLVVSVVFARSIFGHYGQKMFLQYTEDLPFVFPAAFLNSDDSIVLAEKLSDFEKAEAGRTMNLSVSELNYLLDQSPFFASRMHLVQIVDGECQVLLSLPFYEEGEIRFLNGSARLDLSLGLGQLDARIKSFAIAGHSLQPGWVDGLRKNNLVEVIYRDETNLLLKEFIWSIGELRLGEGFLEIVRA